MSLLLVYPHQLYRNLDPKFKKALIIQDSLYFDYYQFHKQKLILHRASMKFYADYLKSKHIEVKYLETEEELKLILKKEKKASVYQLNDSWLERKLKKICNNIGLELEVLDSPNFLTPLNWANQYFDHQGKYFFTSFYIERRKRLKLLIEKDNKPVGGKWSFDAENRKKLPKNHQLPKPWKRKNCKYVEEAISYISKKYPNNPGQISDFNYPVTYQEADEQVEYFFKNQFSFFGDYEDAIARNELHLYHSCLTPSLNIGLLDPEDVLRKALRQKVSLNSLEGFVRQISGWREYMRVLYFREHVKQRTTNYFKFTRKIPKAFWLAKTGIEPIDVTIEKVLKHSYCHHIERLMVLGNFMLLCEFDPDQVHKWFMELFIDSYDWVMVPNVYGMSQYADGGLITTKPYLSSSNYILKMSDYKKGSWCEIWDGLYWRFVDKHRHVFEKNPRMAIMPKQFDKMELSKKQKHIENAEKYLTSLNN